MSALAIVALVIAIDADLIQSAHVPEYVRTQCRVAVIRWVPVQVAAQPLQLASVVVAGLDLDVVVTTSVLFLLAVVDAEAAIRTLPAVWKLSWDHPASHPELVGGIFPFEMPLAGEVIQRGEPGRYIFWIAG